ncbi:DUF1667 domain-containing protein [Salisediminibacterium halotolerans]|uniref:CxxC motif-containing protein n=1 Tax=Salisediminibacterium halotolerans TaxID=517425 RepID=A0A1H9V1C4_9BACI|nr:DUF1667 domain-containing protein [Salisediminibacterium haloalkalitolerans]SES15063.1 CxxC motif-containing protein [Salisediminibacterium haloalkalitolerans]
MKVHEFTCITCPIGCGLEVTEVAKPEGTTYQVEGNTCKRGEKYAIDELTNPLRMVTTTVQIEGAHLRRIPVKTLEPIPKGEIMACMTELNDVVLEAPVDCGEVIVASVCGTEVPVVTTRSIERV